jgi:hypothetical protein
MALNPNHVQTSIRIPKEVHAEIREIAFRHGHSLNEELLLRVIQHEDLIKEVQKLRKQLDSVGIHYS